jgi:hypothetical protein
MFDAVDGEGLETLALPSVLITTPVPSVSQEER